MEEREGGREGERVGGREGMKRRHGGVIGVTHQLSVQIGADTVRVITDMMLVRV